MIRVGLVGHGYIGKKHVEAYLRIPNVKLVAICTRKGNSSDMSDYDAFLLQEDIDVVDICVPTFLHEAFIIKAARAGKHIICEKPLTLTIASANRIHEEVQKAGVKLFVGHVLRFWPEYQTIKAYSESDKLKKIELIFAQRLGQLPNWAKWFQHPEKSGGTLYDLHIHDIDFVFSLLGEVEQVYSVGTKNQYGAWSHLMTTLSFNNGAKAFVEASQRMPKGYPFTMSLRAQSPKNTLDFQLKAGENIESMQKSHFVFYEGDKMTEVDVEQEDAFQKELAYFVDCLERDQENNVIPLVDVMYVLKLLQAMETSLETGHAVKV